MDQFLKEWNILSTCPGDLLVRVIQKVPGDDVSLRSK